MPGGWTMSMAWMRMPGQTWPAAAAAFLGMWVVMMVAMMLPSLVLMLRRYRQAVGSTAASAKATAQAPPTLREGEARTLSMLRANSKTGSKFDHDFVSGRELYMWLNVFDHTQTCQQRHQRPVRIVVKE